MPDSAYLGNVLALCLGTPLAPRPPRLGQTALRDATGPVTYGELYERIRRRSAELRARGIGPGSLMRLGTARVVDTITELLAVLAAEAAFVILADGAEAGPGTRRVLNGEAELPPDAAYVMTTSGSTGVPKETVVTRAGLRHVFGSLLTVLSPHVPPGLHWTQFHPLTFGYAMCEILGSLALGGEMVVVPREQPLTCAALHDCLAGNKAGQVLCLTPSELTLLAQRLRESGGPAPTHVILSGEPAHRTQLADFFALSGAEHTYLVNTYAATETSGQVTVSQITRADVAEAMNGYVGHPLPGVEVTLRGPDGRAVVRADTTATGEIWVSGPTVAAGYLDAEQTAARFGPPGPGGTVAFRTNDVGRWRDDGGLYVVGRGGNTVKVAGRWVALDAVERELLAGGDVSEVSVVPDTLELEGAAPQECLTIVAVPAVREPHVAARVRRAAVAALGAPVTLRLQLCAALPRLHNGKVDLRSLPRPAAAALAHDVASVVRSVWEEILGAGVHADTNLFEAGVDSLGVVTAAVRLSRALGRTVTAAELLDAPRIQTQIARLSQQATAGRQPLAAATRTAFAAAGHPRQFAGDRRRAARAAQIARQQNRQVPDNGLGGNQ